MTAAIELTKDQLELVGKNDDSEGTVVLKGWYCLDCVRALRLITFKRSAFQTRAQRAAPTQDACQNHMRVEPDCNG